MKLDDFESLMEELRQQHFDVSAMTWRLLRLAGQYQNVVIKPRDESALEITINDQDVHAYPIENATGKLRMILARIGSFYMESGAAMGKITLYGFEGKIDLQDNFGSDRQLEIEMKNNNREGFYLVVKAQ
jgi:hypothetical protein